MSFYLFAIFEAEKIDPLSMWEKLSTTHPDIYRKDVQINYSPKTIIGSEVAKQLKKSKQKRLYIEIDKGWLDYSSSSALNFGYLNIQQLVQNTDDGFRWLENLLREESFIYASLHDDEYSRWQNDSVIDRFRQNNHTLSGFRMVKDMDSGEDVVDISHNPGRKVTRDGYAESVGHIMWLGPKFWERTRGDREEVNKHFSLTLIPGTKIELLKAQDEPFTEWTGKSAEVQNLLRDLLYPDHIRLDKELANEREVIRQKYEAGRTKAEGTKKMAAQTANPILQDIGKAAAWIAMAFNSSGYHVMYDLESLRIIDRFFDEHSKNGKANPRGLLAEDLGQRLFAIGAFVGELIRKQKGGEWVADDKDPAAEMNVQLRLPDGTNCWPVQRVMKRFQLGKEESLFAYGVALGLKDEPE